MKDSNANQKQTDRLVKKLSKFGKLDVVKVDNERTTVLITGEGLTNFKTVMQIQSICCGGMHQFVDVNNNSDNHFLLILK